MRRQRLHEAARLIVEDSFATARKLSTLKAIMAMLRGRNGPPADETRAVEAGSWKQRHKDAAETSRRSLRMNPLT